MKIIPALAFLAFCPVVASAAETVSTPAVSGDASAMSDATASEPSPPSDKLGLFLIGYGEYRPTAKIMDGASGTVRRTVADGEIIYSHDVAEGTHLDLDYEAKWTHNEFTASRPTATRRLISSARTSRRCSTSIGASARSPRSNWRPRPTPTSFRTVCAAGGGASLVWNPSKTFTTETGLTVQTQFGQDPTPSPYIRWKWAAAKNFDFEIRATGLTNGVFGTWYVTNDRATSVRVSLSYDTANYGLRDGAFARGFYTGETPLRVTFTQFLCENFFVAARAEVTLQHRESFYTDNTRIAGYSTGVAPVFALMAGVRL